MTGLEEVILKALLWFNGFLFLAIGVLLILRAIK